MGGGGQIPGLTSSSAPLLISPQERQQQTTASQSFWSTAGRRSEPSRTSTGAGRMARAAGLREAAGPGMAVPSGAWASGSLCQLLFAAGGSSCPACPTTCTSPVTALLSGETPTGLSKDLRLPRVGLWALPLPQALDPRCPASGLRSFLQMEWLYPRIPDSHQLQGHQVPGLKSALLLHQDSLLLFSPGAHVSVCE